MRRPRFDGCSPVFVVGSARSGTTLLQLMLNAHPDISLTGELFYFDQILTLRTSIPELASPVHIDALFALLPRLPGLRYLQNLDQALAVVQARLKASPEAGYEALYRYLMEAYAAPGTRRFGEKTTTNLRYLDDLIEIFPACQIIHIVRDPRGSVASRLKPPWTSDDVVTNALKWRVDLSCARSFQQRRDRAGRYLFEVRYEDLVREPAGTLRAVCAFLNEDYHESMLNYHRSAEHFIKDEPWKLGASRPVYASSVELWRAALSAPQQLLIEALTRREMRALGYPLSHFPRRTYAAVPAQLATELHRWVRFKVREQRAGRREPRAIATSSKRLYQLLWRSFARH